MTGVSAEAAGAALPSAQAVTDITTTSLGRSLAEQAASRFRIRVGAAGLAVTTTDLVVLRDPVGITIGPRTATYAVTAVARRGGTHTVEAVPTTIGRVMPTKAAIRTSVAGAWSSVASQCFTRISDGFSWLDHCYSLYRLVGEIDAGRDWFALIHSATMQANVPWVMNAAALGSAPAGNTPQAWADWAPRSDMTSTCRQITVAITMPVGGIRETAEQCEQWTVAKSATAGLFTVKWDGRGLRAARELTMGIAVSVPQGGWPQWYLPASVSGSPF